MKTAVIIGAGGLVGKACLYGLLEAKEYTRVVAVVRKPLPVKSDKLFQLVINFDHPELHQAELVGDDVFCCLGTTIKVAGSQENFRKIDYSYPLQLAKILLKNGASQFMLVSAMGANSTSGIFYNRVKGELEQAIIGLGFTAVKIFRPSLLLGHRNEFRFGERIAQGIMLVTGWLFIGPLRQYKAIPAATVGKAMVKGALNNVGGVCFYPNDVLFDMGV